MRLKFAALVAVILAIPAFVRAADSFKIDPVHAWVIFRIGHLGDLNKLMLLGAIAGAEMAMRDTGIEVELGSGVAAAQAEFRDGMQAKIKQVAAE